MTAHWDAGRGHSLTEDVLRLCLIEALDERSIDATRLAAEVYTPALPKSKLDLTVDGADVTVIEVKYPRDSCSGFSRTR